MKFIIKPSDSSLNLLLETIQYQRIWKLHSRKVYKAFRTITHMEFQQRSITALVVNGTRSTSGIPYQPMELAGDNRSIEFKLMTIIHELSHRLLGGNSLGLIRLGLAKEDSEELNEFEEEMDHRHLYLFEYDVVHEALGENWAQECEKYEKRFADGEATNYDRAWSWAMDMSFSKRQSALKILTDRKVVRKDWEKTSTDKVTHLDPDTWFKKLKP